MESCTKRRDIMAVDFDNTLVENAYPEVGNNKIRGANGEYIVDKLKRLQKEEGLRLILLTCRAGESLDKAVAWCEAEGLVLDAVNDNVPDIIEAFGANHRKIFANYNLDDKNIKLEDLK